MTKITIDRDVVKLALNVLQRAYGYSMRRGEACGALRKALITPIIQPEIKNDKPFPPPEAQTEAEKIAYCAGWWAAMQVKREEGISPPSQAS